MHARAARVSEPSWCRHSPQRGRPRARRLAIQHRHHRGSAAKSRSSPTWSPFPGGEGRALTRNQSYAYMEAIDRASDRVVTGALEQRTWQSRELRYAIVGNPGRLEPAALREDQGGGPDAARPADLRGRNAFARASLSGDPLGRLQRPRRRGVGHRGSLPGALRARRPPGLRRPADPRERDRRPAPNPEPQRARGRHAPPRLSLQLQHQPPRLVCPRPSPRRTPSSSCCTEYPALYVHRRARDGWHEASSSTQFRSHLPRDHRRVRSTGSTTSTAPRWPMS